MPTKGGMMKGYQTPSWFRTKAQIREKEAKVRSGKAKIQGLRKGKQSSARFVEDRK
jgi:hypothetical protein